MVNYLLRFVLFFVYIFPLFLGSSSSLVAMEKERTQFDINNIVTTTATKVFEKINENWTYLPAGAENKHKMYTQSAMWKPQWTKGFGVVDGRRQEVGVATLVLQTAPAKLMEALEDLIAKPAILECTIALTTAKIFCLREILGSKHFNNYAEAFYKSLEVNENWTVEAFFHELPLQFLNPAEGAAIPGSITYVTNLSAYLYFKPNGNGSGINLFCTAQDEYLGFGEIYKTGPQSLDGIESKELLVELIKKEDVERNHVNHDKMIQELQRDTSLFCIERREYQKAIDFYYFFDLAEINKFVATGEIYTLT